jgi:hypothetical protein
MSIAHQKLQLIVKKIRLKLIIPLMQLNIK